MIESTLEFIWSWSEFSKYLRLFFSANVKRLRLYAHRKYIYVYFAWSMYKISLLFLLTARVSPGNPTAINLNYASHLHMFYIDFFLVRHAQIWFVFFCICLLFSVAFATVPYLKPNPIPIWCRIACTRFFSQNGFTLGELSWSTKQMSLSTGYWPTEQQQLTILHRNRLW